MLSVCHHYYSPHGRPDDDNKHQHRQHRHLWQISCCVQRNDGGDYRRYLAEKSVACPVKSCCLCCKKLELML